ncbi:hypothetical protein ACOACQ_05755 [Nocardioides sp. CPCC 206347]|uniref:hypothetical protein n=1 Tax=Nocardioides sp. CPCC 206347 TaxID=3406463 RepID=UPI003B42CFE3
MNTTTRTALRLLIATPLAASAIAFGGFAGTAHADGFEPGPVIIVQPHDDEDPKPEGPAEIAVPKDDEDPKPQGPGDIAIPKDDNDPKPQGPGDITNPEDNDDPKPHGPGDLTNGEDDNDPEGPGDLTNGEDDNDPEGPDDLTNGEPGDKPEDVPADEVPADKAPAAGNDVSDADDVQVPNRIDAGAGSDDEGMNLAWVLAGGGVLTAAGSVLARRKMTANR